MKPSELFAKVIIEIDAALAESAPPEGDFDVKAFFTKQLLVGLALHDRMLEVLTLPNVPAEAAEAYLNSTKKPMERLRNAVMTPDGRPKDLSIQDICRISYGTLKDSMNTTLSQMQTLIVQLESLTFFI